jgi:hypothetical protein
MKRESTPTPEPIAQLQRQLEQFRSTSQGVRSCRNRCGRLRSHWPANTACIPSPVIAVGLYDAEKRLGGSPTFRRKATKPAFVELVASPRARLEGCVIEFESSGGVSPGTAAAKNRCPFFRRPLRNYGSNGLLKTQNHKGFWLGTEGAEKCSGLGLYAPMSTYGQRGAY